MRRLAYGTRGAGGATSVASLLALAVPASLAAQTLPGTAIANVATVRSATGAAASNPVTLLVAERLDCTLARVATNPGSVTLLLTNGGTGHEAFSVTATTGPGAAPLPIAVGGDGRFDAAHDQPLVGGTTPVIAPGATLRLIVPVADGVSTLTVSATAVTGSGASGTVFAAKGDGGGDAVVGQSGAAARLVIDLAAESAPPTLTQTQTVLAPDGSTSPRHDAIVTYTLEARFPAATTAARLIDPIPANTTYRPATLTLDGASLPDAGHVADGRITVSLGAVAAGAVHHLSFKVVIP